MRMLKDPMKLRKMQQVRKKRLVEETKVSNEGSVEFENFEECYSEQNAGSTRRCTKCAVTSEAGAPAGAG